MNAATSLDDRPFPIYDRNDFRVFLGTDNRLVGNTTLGKELYLAATHCGLTRHAMIPDKVRTVLERHKLKAIAQCTP